MLVSPTVRPLRYLLQWLDDMPLGSPGMDGAKEAPFVIYEISDGAPKIYATE